MSDYMFMLESHLSPEQNQVVSLVEAVNAQAGLNSFLTGGAMRDMMGGFPIRALQFTVEGNPGKLIKTLTEKHSARIVEKDDSRKAVRLLFANDLKAWLGMAVVAKYGRPGSKPQYTAETIHEDLKGRDFTMNSIALSLNKSSRGLLLDPMNGLSDLERREIRANSNYTLYDEPARILKMFRYRARMGFELDARTQSQYENVREAKLEEKVSAPALLAELHAMATEPNPEQLLESLDKEKLLTLFSPVLAGPQLNLAGFSKFTKARQSIPFGVDFRAESFGLFMDLLTERFSAKEKSHLVKSLGMSGQDVELWQKLETRAKKLEKSLKSGRLNKASLVYLALREAPADQVMYLYLKTGQRIVHDRIKNYLQKYLPAAQEVNDKDIAHLGLTPGTPKFKKAKEEYTLAKLDGRIRKPAPPPEPAPAPPPPPMRTGIRR